jgi:acetyl esterase/lipase
LQEQSRDVKPTLPAAASFRLVVDPFGRTNMPRFLLALAVLALVGPLTGYPACAQVEKLPPYLQATLDRIGPVFQSDIGKNIPATIAAFQPLLKAAPKDGVTVIRNEAYGEDPRQVLDVYEPTPRNDAPIVIFVHGGAYVRGDKDGAGEAYGNIAT